LAFCIDKIKVKKLLSYHTFQQLVSILYIPWMIKLTTHWYNPLIVKPANTDNSIGITNKSVVTNEKELRRQLEEVVVKAGRPALVEEYIGG